MRRAIATFAISVLVAACGSTSQIRQPIEPLSAATAVFSVEKPVNAVPRSSDQPPEHFLSAISSYLKSELAKNGRLAKEGDDALKIDIQPLHAPPREGDIRDSMADITLARKVLGYEPQVGLHEGLRRSIDYYRSLTGA